MNTPAYDKDVTALLLVDPYNDFISEGGKIWPRIKAVAEANNCVAHMLEVLQSAARRSCGSSMPCIIATARATTKRGNTLRPFRKGHGNTGPLNSALGVASSAPNLCRSQVKL